jgi:hypothetical protein
VASQSRYATQYRHDEGRGSMGTVLLLVSVLCVAVGTWKLIGIYKESKPDSKPLWFTVTGVGIALFFLLKLLMDSALMIS